MEVTIPIGIHISDEAHPILPNVYNLSFGPVNALNQIDDKIKLAHENHSKLFSTIVFTATTFLEKKPTTFLGIDGSTNARAYMYYRCIQNNYDYLNKYLNIYGVNYYIRVFREEEKSSSTYEKEDFVALPHAITKESSLRYKKLYNYFIFNTK